MKLNPRPDGMVDYIIHLRSPELDANGRVPVFHSYVGITGAFLGKLRNWLALEGFGNQVVGMSPPQGFPMVTLTCTSFVAEMIKAAEFEEIVSIFADEDDIGLVY
jgi:hypothetical protein